MLFKQSLLMQVNLKKSIDFHPKVLHSRLVSSGGHCERITPSTDRPTENTDLFGGEVA